MGSDETRLDSPRERGVWVEHRGTQGLSLVWLLRKYPQLSLETQPPRPPFPESQAPRSRERHLRAHVAPPTPLASLSAASPRSSNASGRLGRAWLITALLPWTSNTLRRGTVGSSGNQGWQKAVTVLPGRPATRLVGLSGESPL